MTTLAKILEGKIVAIIRGAKPDDVVKIAGALQEGGVRALEITMNSSKALSVIEEVAARMGEQVLVGAGTVLDAQTAVAAIDAGAKFIISPTLDIETIKATRRYGAVSIPGAYTPTEVLTAYSNGGDIIKVFPASSPNYIKDIKAPLSQIPLMPTGGVNLDNIAEFQKAGGVAFGIASALVDTKRAVTDEYLEELTEKAMRFVQAVNIKS
jgi:2-dehydro-3-deoxyphosphogluconate aldolase/(4S)-4-hydroxy-2-oxoglutarate aldolase